LTDGADQHPHSVLLLDEIEKAHPDLFNILLQVMDHGKLTDHNGKSVDFRNVILIMTTNAGAQELAKPPIGFNRTRREGEDEEAINRMFSPEFRNRLDATITFANLPREVVRRVVEKFVLELEAQLADRHVVIVLSEEAADWIAEEGYDERFGARPLSRVIQEHVKKPLADEVLFGRLEKGGTVTVTLEDKPDGSKGLGFAYEAGEPPRSRSRPKRAPRPKKGGPDKGGAGGSGTSVPKVPLLAD
jgi:ATP-dependent Clp protease ATP-binding subunit ClpA